MRRINTLLTLFVLLFAGSTFAKNARVVEIQDKIKADIEQFMNKFAPNAKYSVKVNITPLRRTAGDISEENLPFMEFEQDYVQDEWDSNESNIYDLLSRIKEARVSLYIDDKIRIEDRSRFKDALLNEVNLVPGRDSVSIETISSPMMNEAFSWKNYSEIFLFGGILFLTVILGVGLNSLSNNLRPSAGAASEGARSAVAPSPVSSPMMNSSKSQGNLGNNMGEIKGDLNIQDPTKINEIVTKKIAKLIESEYFPKLSDMVYLEELLNEDISSFSYLVYEFPQLVQKNIYQKGKGNKWFHGFSDVGFPSKKVLIILDKMLRDREVLHSKEFEDLLIYSWRLDDKLVSFIKSIDKESAFTILKKLPKNISIPVARECFPGFWGTLLQSGGKIKIDHNLNKELVNKTLTLVPHFNYSSLEDFKNRKDLFQYLDSVEPHEERDVYSVLEDSKQLEKVRPAFFRFFELDQEMRRTIFEKYSLEDWSKACFNIERSEKEKITAIMDDREKYMFSFGLKSIDENPALAATKVNIRMQIAKDVYETLLNKAENINIEKEVTPEEEYAA